MSCAVCSVVVGRGRTSKDHRYLRELVLNLVGLVWFAKNPRASQVTGVEGVEGRRGRASAGCTASIDSAVVVVRYPRAQPVIFVVMVAMKRKRSGRAYDEDEKLLHQVCVHCACCIV